MANNTKKQILKLAKEIIKERVWYADDYSLHNVFVNEKAALQRIKQYPVHKVLFIEKENSIPLIWKSFTHFDKLKPEQSFIERICALPSFNYDSLLFLMTCYQYLSEKDFGRIIKDSISIKRFSSVFEQLLAPSFGYLVYAHQLEQLYMMLTGVGINEAIIFRKDWNIKRRIARDLASEIQIDNDLNLTALINERALDKEHLFCFHAQQQPAYLLYKHLFR